MTDSQFVELKTRLKATWMTGNYDVFSRFMQKGVEDFFGRLDIAPETRLLDVACGAGQLALIAARAGARVTGCDIATNWLDDARARAAGEGLAIVFEEGDAEALPYEGGRFDAVVSLIGAMFAPRPDRVAAELTRVCRRGGVIGWRTGRPVDLLERCSRRLPGTSLLPACLPLCCGAIKPSSASASGKGLWI